MDIIEILTNFGFPICACIGMAIWCDKQLKQNREDVKELNKIHSEEIKELKMDMCQTLNKNTEAIEKLTDYIKERDFNAKRD